MHAEGCCHTAGTKQREPPAAAVLYYDCLIEPCDSTNFPVVACNWPVSGTVRLMQENAIEA